MHVPARETASLEVRRRAIRARHRRAALRERAGMAVWGVGLLAGGVLAVALAVGLTGR